jgi:hypothetical protein
VRLSRRRPIPVRAISRLELKPGDVLVVHVKDRASYDDVASLSRSLREAFPDSSVVVAAAETSFSVLRAPAFDLFAE